jgi:hypothetical protein
VVLPADPNGQFAILGLTKTVEAQSTFDTAYLAATNSAAQNGTATAYAATAINGPTATREAWTATAVVAGITATAQAESDLVANKTATTRAAIALQTIEQQNAQAEANASQAQADSVAAEAEAKREFFRTINTLLPSLVTGVAVLVGLIVAVFAGIRAHNEVATLANERAIKRAMPRRPYKNGPPIVIVNGHSQLFGSSYNPHQLAEPRRQLALVASSHNERLRRAWHKNARLFLFYAEGIHNATTDERGSLTSRDMIAAGIVTRDAWDLYTDLLADAEVLLKSKGGGTRYGSLDEGQLWSSRAFGNAVRANEIKLDCPIDEDGNVLEPPEVKRPPLTAYSSSAIRDVEAIVQQQTEIETSVTSGN